MGQDCFKDSFTEEGNMSSSMMRNFEPHSFWMDGEKDDPIMENQNLMMATALHIQKIDNGKDEPGAKHLPDENEKLKYIRDLPSVFKDMFKKLENQFGKWVVTPTDRTDDFKVEIAKNPVEIIFSKKPGANNPLNVYKSHLPSMLDLVLAEVKKA